jgi:hypothetical protein
VGHDEALQRLHELGDNAVRARLISLRVGTSVRLDPTTLNPDIDALEKSLHELDEAIELRPDEPGLFHQKGLLLDHNIQTLVREGYPEAKIAELTEAMAIAFKTALRLAPDSMPIRSDAEAAGLR